MSVDQFHADEYFCFFCTCNDVTFCKPACSTVQRRCAAVVRCAAANAAGATHPQRLLQPGRVTIVLLRAPCTASRHDDVGCSSAMSGSKILLPALAGAETQSFSVQDAHETVLAACGPPQASRRSPPPAPASAALLPPLASTVQASCSHTSTARRPTSARPRSSASTTKCGCCTARCWPACTPRAPPGRPWCASTAPTARPTASCGRCRPTPKAPRARPTGACVLWMGR